MCILSGCDYLDSLPGIGLAKACKFVLLTEETDLKKSLLKLPSYLNLKNVVVTQDYIDNFLVAEATFKHMFVYCPIKRAVVRLNEIPGDHPEIEALCKNAGVNDLDEETAFNLALGNLNPFGLKKLDDFNPDTHKLTPSNKFEKITVAKHSSIWLKNFKKHQPKSNEKLCAFQFVTKSKDKILNKVVENLEDDEKSEEDESSIMEMYAQKEYLSYNEDNFKDLEEKEHNSINKKRNPFGKSVSERDIFKENTTSLLKTLSPKKREIKTVREVRSRFFLPFVKQENSSKNNDNSKKSLENVEKYINDPLKSEKRKCSDDLQRPPKQLFTEKIKTENNKMLKWKESLKVSLQNLIVV
uniref:Exonuclease 1 n=1 Tax=Megaselia scalaris TaxID=36166 RepID=T1GQM6_MEGSC